MTHERFGAIDFVIHMASTSTWLLVKYPESRLSDSAVFEPYTPTVPLLLLSIIQQTHSIHLFSCGSFGCLRWSSLALWQWSWFTSEPITWLTHKIVLKPLTACSCTSSVPCPVKVINQFIHFPIYFKLNCRRRLLSKWTSIDRPRSRHLVLCRLLLHQYL